MQERPQLAPPNPELTAAAVRARVLFSISLAGFAAGPLLVAGGILFGRIDRAFLGVLICGAAWSIRHWLRRRGEWDAAVTAFDAIGEMPSLEYDGPEAQFLQLLQQRDELETKRGSPGFDPWALQVVRRNIQTAVDQDAALARIFHTYERQKRMS